MSDDDPRSGFTRRDLVRGALVGAVATGIAPKGPPSGPATVGPEPAPLTLDINGTRHDLHVAPRVVLAEALRDELGLTGTKVVCGRGACGACTVLLDGETVCSCLVLAHAAAGRRITTIEGLAQGGKLAPVQEAFVAADALQCGFCTSGMVMSCHALLARNARPSGQEIREAVAGNLCRCGTYPHVFEAVERAAGVRTADAGDAAGATVVTLAVSGLRLAADPRVEAAVIEMTEVQEG
ncbi:MAG TPA: (2Fe-2S)-binding protein [Thermoanaerobaculia bacterium]|jgi:aerobic-type carbon monoxide dehydrogenase small subunit (CoxS/CutS family)